MKKIVTLVAVLCAALLLLPAAAFAQTATPTATPAPATPTANQRLEYQYQRQKLALQATANRISEMEGVIALNATTISNGKAAGIDVSRLERRQTQLQAALETTKLNYNQAKTLLDQHSGFDANGKVTDTSKAQATLTQVESLLKAAHGGGMMPGGHGGRGGRGGRGGQGEQQGNGDSNR